MLPTMTLSTKFIPLTFIIALCSLVFISCSDEFKSTAEVDDANNLRIEFTIPEAEHIVTRGRDNTDERKINSLTFIIFNSQKDDVLQKITVAASEIDGINTTLNSEDNRNSFTYHLNLDSKFSDPYVYVIANLSQSSLLDEFSKNSGKSVADLELTTSSSYSDGAGGLLMSGAGNSVANSVSIALTRTAAKITLKDENPSDAFELSDIGFSSDNIAGSCYLTAGTGRNVFVEDNKTGHIQGNKVTGSDGSVRYDSYAMPTKTFSTIDGNSSTVFTYIIIEGKYEGRECFYAVPLYNKTTGIYYDIEPNRWYDIRITGINAPGYPDKASAIQHPSTGDVEYLIYDYSPEVLSIVSDGIRELGVTPEVKMTGHTETFTVNCLSLIDVENVSSNKPLVTIKSGSTWLSVNSGELISNSDDKSGANGYSGMQWSFNLSANNASQNDEAQLEVAWQGLKRTIQVSYSGSAKISDICEVDLHIYKGKSSTYTPEPYYWNYLSVMKGIDRNSLDGGNVRDDGFHFPMPYGNPDSNGDIIPWEYEYQINFDDTRKPFPNYKRILTVEAVVTDDSDPLFKDLSWQYNDTQKRGTLNLPTIGDNKKSYKYCTGTIQFTVKYDNGFPNSSNPLPDFSFKVPLYHTGFFHNLGNESDDMGVYYYEVVKVGDFYWLDRNIGATSNKMYIDNGTNGSSGDVNAKGRFYTVATPNDDNINPAIHDGSDVYEICPPGYHVPNTTEWDNLLTSSDASTLNFPKARYYNETNTYSSTYVKDANTGDYGSGYYWTRTSVSGGTGNMLIAISLSEENQSYFSASIRNDKLNLRCVAGVKPVADTTIPPVDPGTPDPDIDSDKNTYRLYWPVTKGNKIHVWQNSTDLTNGDMTGTYDPNMKFYWVEFKTADSGDIVLRLTTNNEDDLTYSISTFKEEAIEGKSEPVYCAFFDGMTRTNPTLNQGKPKIAYSTSNFEPFDIIRIKWSSTKYEGYDKLETNLRSGKNEIIQGDEIKIEEGYYIWDCLVEKDTQSFSVTPTDNDQKWGKPYKVTTSDVTIDTEYGRYVYLYE